MNHIEPKRQFTQLDGRRIQVHTIHVVRGDIGFHLLQLISITIGSRFLLYICHVGFRQLVDYFIKESRCTNSRFQYLQVEQIHRLALTFTHFIHDGLDGIFDGAACEYFRCIVAGRLLTITTIQSINESTPWQTTRFTCLIIANHLSDVESFHARIGNQISAIFRRTCFAYFDIIFFGIETTIGQQRLID